MEAGQVQGAADNGSDDSDELDDEISKLEQSMVEDDEDTDEDHNEELPDFSNPTAKKRLSHRSSGDSHGLGANPQLRQQSS